MSLAIGLNLLPVFLNSLRQSFGTTLLTLEELGRLGALAFAGLSLGIVATGPLVDRWGAKLFVQIGNALIAISLAGMIFVPSYAELGFAVFVLGVGAGILDMVLSPVVAAMNPESRSSSMNWLHSFYCVGAVVTISAGTLVLQMGWSWRTACLVLLPLPLALFATFARMTFPSMVSEEGRTHLGTILKEKWFLGAMAAIFLGGATELGMAQWLPAYAESALGFPQWIAGGSLWYEAEPFSNNGLGMQFIGGPVPGGIVSASLLARPGRMCACRIYRQLSVANNAGGDRGSLS